jgi:glycosyltransferase involved in cell wall biosynthesis
VATSTTLLWRGLQVVAPGQDAKARAGALGTIRRLAEGDARAGQVAVRTIRPGGDGLVVFGDKPLDPTADSASHRLGHLLSLALDAGRPVAYFSTRQGRWYRVDPGVRLTPDDPPELASVAWIVRPEAGAAMVPALQRFRPALRVVYDTLDLHYLRLERESKATGGRGRRLQARLMKELEQRLAAGAAVAVAISAEEEPLLRQLAPGTEVVVLPNVHEPRADAAPPLAERDGLLFVGNFTHTPNVDAVDVLAAEVMPRLWAERSELALTVAGHGLEPERFTDPRIRVVGWVDDLDALVDRSALLVAPLRFGAGLKGKIGYAIARGLPVVTTETGAEGFPRPAGMSVVPGGDWTAFAGRVLELLGDAELWAAKSREGIELTREEYSPAVLRERFLGVLEP